MSEMNPALLRCLLAGGLFLGTMGFSLIPVILSRKAQQHDRTMKSIISALSCFGGGVFLGTLMLHLMPEANEKMSDALKDMDVDFPIPFAIMICGFMLVLLSEQLILACKLGGIGHGHSHGEDDFEPEVRVPPPGVANYGALDDNQEIGAQQDPAVTVPSSAGVESDDDDRMTTVSTHGDPGSHSKFRSIIMVFALSLHSIFEGIAIGLQKSNQQAIQVLVTIILHKIVIAFTLSTKLVNQSSRIDSVTVFSCITVFAAMAPIGILIAILISGTPPLINGVFQCIASGTFIYITFFEILPHEINSKHGAGSRFLKTLMLMLGVGCVVALLLLFPDED